MEVVFPFLVASIYRAFGLTISLVVRTGIDALIARMC
jgi:hypothetical protein